MRAPDSDSIELDDDAPLTLRDAAHRAFPSGGVTAAKLRRAIESGKLKGYRVGRTVFTTLKDIRVMLDASVIKPQRRVDRHARHEAPDPLGQTRAEAAQDRALTAIARLKNAREKLKK